VERNLISEGVYTVTDRSLADRRSRTGKSARPDASALTKEAFWILVLLSSLGLWAAIWTAIASLVSAWVQ
jgi:hypothetical protein